MTVIFKIARKFKFQKTVIFKFWQFQPKPSLFTMIPKENFEKKVIKEILNLPREFEKAYFWYFFESGAVFKFKTYVKDAKKVVWNDMFLYF